MPLSSPKPLPLNPLHLYPITQALPQRCPNKPRSVGSSSSGKKLSKAREQEARPEVFFSSSPQSSIIQHLASFLGRRQIPSATSSTQEGQQAPAPPPAPPGPATAGGQAQGGGGGGGGGQQQQPHQQMGMNGGGNGGSPESSAGEEGMFDSSSKLLYPCPIIYRLVKRRNNRHTLSPPSPLPSFPPSFRRDPRHRPDAAHLHVARWETDGNQGGLDRELELGDGGDSGGGWRGREGGREGGRERARGGR